MKWMKVLVIIVAVIFLQACEKDVVCEDNTYYKEGDRCIRKALNTVDFVVPEGMDEIESVDLYEGFLLELPEIDVDFDYGWFTNDTYTTPFDINKGVIRDMTLYLRIEGGYTFNFYVGTAEGEDHLMSSNLYYTIPEDDEMSGAEVDGYDFLGWYIDPERNTEYTANSELFDENFEVDLYGLFEISTYTITFVVPEIMYPLDAIEVEYQETFQKPLLDIERNHTWYTDDTYETVYNFNTPVTGDRSIYLVLEDVNFYVAYHVGTAILEYQQFDEIEDITSHPEPERSGLEFVGWYVDKNLTIPVEDVELVKDELHPVIHLYGSYEIAQYTITYMINNEVFAYREYYQNDVINPYIPSGNYGFNGWYRDPELTQSFNDIMMPGEDITVYGTMNYDVADFDSLTALRDGFYGTGVIRVKGTVIAYARDLMYVSDGETVMEIAVYDRIFYDFPKGMTISLIGTVYSSDGILHMNDVLSALEVEMNPTLDWPVIESSVTELLAVKDDLTVAQRFYITGFLQKRDNVLSLFDGEYVIDFYTPMDATAASILDQYVDQTVTIDVFYYNLYTVNGELVNAVFGFDGTAADITVHDMSDQVYTVDFVVPDTIDPIESMTLTHGEYITLPVIDTEFRYGWFINDNFITEFDASYPIVDNLTLYYSVLPDPIQITYVVDGQVVNVVEHFPGDDLEFYEPDLGYMERFDGWYTDIEMTSPFIGTFVPYDSLTLYGRVTWPETEGYFTSVADFVDSDLHPWDFIAFEGIVVYNDDFAFFVTDGTENISVYTNVAYDVEPGDHVILYGNMNVLYSYTEMDVYGYEVVSTNHTIPLVPIEMTFDEFIEADLSQLERQLFSVTGIIGGSSTPLMMSDDSSHMLIFESYGGESQLVQEQLLELEGQLVTVTFIYTGSYGREFVEYHALPIAIGDVVAPEMMQVTYMIDDEVVHTDTFFIGQYMNLYAPLDPDDYFDGWYTDETLETRFDDMYAPEEDIILYGAFRLPVPVADFTSLQDFMDSNYTEEDHVSFTGIVTFIDEDYLFVTDGTLQLILMKFPLEYSEVVIGDRLIIHGNITYIENMFLRMQSYYYEIVSRDNPIPLETTAITYQDFITQAMMNSENYLQFYTITGVIHARDNYHFNPFFGDTEEGALVMSIIIPNGGDSDILNQLDSLDGQTITIQILYLQYYELGDSGTLYAIIISDEIIVLSE